jgi:hypothetical protein
VKVKDRKAYEDWKDKQRGHDDPMADAYGLACFSYADRWATMMEAEMAANPDVDFGEMAKRLSHEADVEGITGFIYGMAVGILSECWVEGDLLRRWHNKRHGVADDKLDDGVVNPAVLTIGKKKE